MLPVLTIVFFSSRRRHTRYWRDWSSDVCSSDLSGLLADATPGSSPSSATSAPTAAALSGVARVWPSGVTTTTCAVAPPAAPNSSLIRSRAVVDSWPGMAKLSDVSPASVAAPAPPPTSSTSQTRTTAARCRCENAPSLDNRRAMGDQASTWSGPDGVAPAPWWPSASKQVATMCRRHARSEEHTSELQSRQYLVCRLLLEKK